MYLTVSVHVCIYVCNYICMCVYVCMYIYTCVYIYIYIYNICYDMCTCMYMYICNYVCSYICMYVWYIYTFSGEHRVKLSSHQVRQIHAQRYITLLAVGYFSLQYFSFRQELQHFVTVMESYISNEIFHVSWKEFEYKFTKVSRDSLIPRLLIQLIRVWV